MVVERFRRGAAPVYERAAEHGRLLPAGLEYLDSWIDQRLDRCFQLMETDDPRVFDEWTARWSDLVEFEVVPVITSADATGEPAVGSDAERAIEVAMHLHHGRIGARRRDGRIETQEHTPEAIDHPVA